MEMENFDYCQIAELSDIGQKRQANEDSCGHRDTINGRAVTVCDGMGGAVGGATASSIAVNTILDFLSQEYIEDANQAIIKAIDAANKAIIAEGQRNPKLQGMGTTCVLLLVREGKVFIGSVGDSRVYIVQNHNAIQLTKDQSYVQMLVDSHAITPQQARTHPRRNEITNALGLPNMKPATVLSQNPIATKAGDCFLLCSDGLSGMVDDEKIGKIVSKYDVNINQRAKMLIDEANKNGGTDNITVQIVEFPITHDQRKKEGTLPKKRITIILGLIAVCLIVAVCTLIYLKKVRSNSTTQTNTTTVNPKPEPTLQPIKILKQEKDISLKGAVVYSKGASFLLLTITNESIIISVDNKKLETLKGKFERIDYPKDFAFFDKDEGCFRWTDKNYTSKTFSFTITTTEAIYNCSIKVKPGIVTVPNLQKKDTTKNDNQESTVKRAIKKVTKSKTPKK